MSSAIGFEELKALTGLKSASAVEKCLKDQDIQFFYGGPDKNKTIFTTIELMNAAKGISSKTTETADEYI